MPVFNAEGLNIYNMSVCMSTLCPYVKMHRRNSMAQARACSKSVLGGKRRPVAHRYYLFLLYARAALAWTKSNIKCSLKNEKRNPYTWKWL